MKRNTLFLLSLLILSSCTNFDANNYTLAELQTKAAEYKIKKKYEKAGDMYFRIWCKSQDSQALEDSGIMFLEARKYEKALNSFNDLITFKGDGYSNYKSYLNKALIYYSQVKSVERDISTAKNALLNLEIYKNNAKNIDKEKVAQIELYLQNIIAYSKLLDAQFCLTNHIPNYIEAMKYSLEIINTNNINQDIKEAAKNIYKEAKKMINS